MPKSNGVANAMARDGSLSGAAVAGGHCPRNVGPYNPAQGGSVAIRSRDSRRACSVCPRAPCAIWRRVGSS